MIIDLCGDYPIYDLTLDSEILPISSPQHSRENTHCLNDPVCPPERTNGRVNSGLSVPEVSFPERSEGQTENALILGLLSLPMCLIKIIFDDFLMIKNIHYILYGNLMHMKNALYNECVIERSKKSIRRGLNKKPIKWGKIYKYERKDIYKLLDMQPHLSKKFLSIFKDFKVRADNVSKIVYGTILTIQTVRGVIETYFVDGLTSKSVLGIKLLVIDKIEVRDKNGIIISNNKNVVTLLNSQRWLDINYLKQEHLVFFDFQPLLFFLDNDFVPIGVSQFSRIVNFFEITQTKKTSDFVFDYIS
jgi:hypothetical protein